MQKYSFNKHPKLSKLAIPTQNLPTTNKEENLYNCNEQYAIDSNQEIEADKTATLVEDISTSDDYEYHHTFTQNQEKESGELIEDLSLTLNVTHLYECETSNSIQTKKSDVEKSTNALNE